ncbi:MAG TPA: hypothetical protein VHL31_26505 [Geminicoccus sp.]|jgi:hypothetical protein|uniref:hypothetical protein n=1 Tax=Geminicoccus sp. TaxID=2024832 RepID=UPI002E2FF6A3|nr:hypothetical protein [Geminicoccus sp.]HEX2529830.1 hypothetical protein [Geminicoccus sp.]
MSMMIQTYDLINSIVLLAVLAFATWHFTYLARLSSGEFTTWQASRTMKHRRVGPA